MVGAAMDDVAPSPETAETLLAALRRLDSTGLVEIRIEPKRLNHIDCPVASEADGNIWVYAFIALAGAAWWWRGLAAGAITLGLGVVVYLTLGRFYMHRRIRRRVREEALQNVDTWRKLWRFRGLTLAAKDQPGVSDCASPDGNWMAFVRSFG
jgi:hypothetical protein